MKKVLEVVNIAEKYIAAACLVIATSITFIASITRSFGHPINWSIDISLFLWAWCIFLTADLAFRQDKLVAVDNLMNLLPKKAKKINILILYLIILAFLIALLVYGSMLVYTSRMRPFQSISVLSYSWVTLSLPLGALLLIRTTIPKIIRLFKKTGTTEEQEKKDYLSIAKEEVL